MNIQAKHIRSFKKSCVESVGGCWTWTAYKTRSGYGRIGVNGKTLWAHRFSWMLRHGEIPDGCVICHHCDNPTCVNPDHLFIGSQSDNLQDCSAKGRISKGSNRPASKLTEQHAAFIKQRIVAGEKQKDLAAEFSVSPATISMLKTNKSWKHASTYQ